MSPEELAAMRAVPEKLIAVGDELSIAIACIVNAAINHIDAQAAEIERLRAIIDKPLEERIWIMDRDILNASSDDAEIYLARRWHSAYRKAQNSNLIRAQEIERLRADLERQATFPKSVNAMAAGLHIAIRKTEEQAARIQELEDAPVEERARRAEECPRDVTGSWQVTEERKAALAAMSDLSETISCPDCGVWIGFADIGPHMAVLRAMLEEVGQE